MNRIIYSIFIDIPNKDLDNPGWYNPEGVQQKTDKSKVTKDYFLKYYDRIKKRHQEYADSLGVEYVLHEYDNDYKKYVEYFQKNYPQISVYDIINFYKQELMARYAQTYDEVCYFDFDVIPATTESIFDAVPSDSFGCAHSNKEAEWGKNIEIKWYNTCIRNPSSKYWNCHAMLAEEGYEPDTDVFNTGIMVARSDQILKLDYFGEFEEVLDLMSKVKYDKASMYPKNIQRIFNYDNETVFAFKRIVNDVKICYLNGEWHHKVQDEPGFVFNHDAKIFHVINKRFRWFFK
tara:strand:+ start:365 stop:1234 length:870 start_codon:yes stop_codon:yes gene_type:complete